MEYFADRVLSWMTFEPLVGVMMVVATIVLFVGAYRRRGADHADGFWPWARRTLEALSTALLFLALLWGFRAVLGDNARSFSAGHGRVTEANYQSVKAIWGEPHIQRELRVTLAAGGDAIEAVDGHVDIVLNERRKGSALYNGFDADIELAYTIHNPHEGPTDAEMFFQLASQKLLDDLRVETGGGEVEDLEFLPSGVRWHRQLAGGEQIEVVVRYRTRGVEYFYYQVPERRALRNFRLEIAVDGMAIDDVNYPNGCITPQELEETALGVTLVWALDRAVTTAGMGVALPKPQQPGAEVAMVLDRSPYSLMLLLVAVGLTLMVRRQVVSFLDLALLAAGYCVVFLTMASASDYMLGFWGSLTLGAAMSMALCWWLFRRHESRRMVTALAAFFVVVFPLAGLAPDHSEAFDGAVAVALIVYLFALALRSRPTT